MARVRYVSFKSFNVIVLVEKGMRAFHKAFGMGQTNVAKTFMENSVTLNNKINAKDKEGQTAYQMVFRRLGHSNVVKIKDLYQV